MKHKTRRVYLHSHNNGEIERSRTARAQLRFCLIVAHIYIYIVQYMSLCVCRRNWVRKWIRYSLWNANCSQLCFMLMRLKIEFLRSIVVNNWNKDGKLMLPSVLALSKWKGLNGKDERWLWWNIVGSAGCAKELLWLPKVVIWCLELIKLIFFLIRLFDNEFCRFTSVLSYYCVYV